MVDDLARALATPMPRRRAVRVIGASLAAIAVPGIPARARAATGAPHQGSPNPPSACVEAGGLKSCCHKGDWVPGTTTRWKVCDYPAARYGCKGRDNLTCVDRCLETTQSALPPGKTAKPTWSSATDANRQPKKYDCCITPDTIPKDGECLPSCEFTHGPGAHQCGRTCCPRSQRCVIDREECKSCPSGLPLPCGWHCCDPAEEQCLNVSSQASRGVKRLQCVDKCAPGKRRCISKFGELGECCPKGYPCCGTSCGCDGRGEECVRLSGGHKVCLRKCLRRERRCNIFCCTPDRMYQYQLPDGRTICRCRRTP